VNGLEFGATVLRPGRFIGTHGGRLLFAVGNDGELSGADTKGNQVVFGSQGTAFAESQVVFIRTALVAVTFDDYLGAAVGLQLFGVFCKGFSGIGRKSELIKLKVNVFHSSQIYMTRYRFALHGVLTSISSALGISLLAHVGLVDHALLCGGRGRGTADDTANEKQNDQYYFENLHCFHFTLLDSQGS
jgi:hypothetical protein